MAVNALKKWEGISKETICKKAVSFFLSNSIKKYTVLKQGAADFDKKVTENDKEKARYRAAYYMSHYGYMNMHLRQNLAAFDEYLVRIGKGSSKILFVDFGCGPMTAGLALAENLSNKNKNYRKNTFYRGIDCSKNMCQLAQAINEKHKLFDKKRFSIVQDNVLNLTRIHFSPDIIILNFSFVLAPNTLKGGTKHFPRQIAESWHNFFVEQKACRATLMIYHNPAHSEFHQNWRKLVRYLKNTARGSRISYNAFNIRPCYWNNNRWSTMACIQGKKS